MFVCVVPLSQMLYVKCLWVLSRYLRCYVLNVCVCCLVISDVILNVCVCCLLSQMLYVKCLCVLSSLSEMIHDKCLYVCCLVISDVIC